MKPKTQACDFVYTWSNKYTINGYLMPVKLCLANILGVMLNCIISLAITDEFLNRWPQSEIYHHSDVIMIAMASQITCVLLLYSTVYSGADHRKNQSSASLAFLRGTHRWPVKYSHKGPETRKMVPFDDVIMIEELVNSLPQGSILGPLLFNVFVNDIFLLDMSFLSTIMLMTIAFHILITMLII